jgi:UDP-N-acetylmuramoylalanine--D-glutamate ligase
MEKEKMNYLVVGLGKTGIETLKFIGQRGFNPRGTDNSPRKLLDDKAIIGLMESGIKIEFEAHSDEYLEWADELIISPGVSINTPYLVKAKKLNKIIVSEIEFAARFISKPIIAITGSNGKTTTTSLISEILKNSGFNIFTGGNIGTPLISAAPNAEEYDFIVLETSSFQLQATDKFKPFISVFLNVSPNHLDHHKDFDEYFHSKTKIFKNQTSDDWAIINSGDENIKKCTGDIKSEIIGFGNGSEIENIVLNSHIVEFRNEKYDLTGMKLIGEHNLDNAMCAIAASKIAGCSKEIIEKTIVGFEPLPHRIEYIGRHRGVNVYNDSKSTSPGATLKALESISPPIILLAGGKDKGTDYKVLTSTLNQKVKHLVLFGEAKKRMKQQLGMSVDTTIANSLEEAVETAFLNSSDNDSILLSPACSSFDMFSSYEERGEVFKKIVENI